MKRCDTDYARGSARWSVQATPEGARPVKRDLDALHARAVAGDREARDEFCRRVFIVLCRQRRGRPIELDADLVDESIVDAVMKLWHEPERYDPNLGNPITFAKKICHDCLVDRIRKSVSRRAHETTQRIDFGSRGCASAEVNPEVRLLAEEAARETHRRRFAVCRTADERAFVEALFGSTIEEAENALGIAHLPADARKGQLRRVVKRLHERAERADRNRRRLRRGARRKKRRR